jgi:FkbM family methyltransferase
LNSHPWFQDTRNYPRQAEALTGKTASPLIHRLYARYARSPKHPCKLRILAWLETIFGLQEVTVPTRCGLMRLNSRDYLQRVILLENCFEATTLDLMKDILQPGDAYVDVGANIGHHALWGAQCVGPEGRVLAVEPNPEICRSLLVQRRLNHLEQRMEVAALALSDRNELLTFEAPPFWNLGLSRQLKAGESFLGLEQFHVATTTLQELCRNRGFTRIKLLKIDTEGSELRVLGGVFGSDQPSCDNIIFEYMPNDFVYGNTPEDYLHLLRSEGYEIVEIDGSAYRGGAPKFDDNLWARKTRPANKTK